MRVTFSGRAVRVTREPGEPRIPRESTFWHKLRGTLNGQRPAGSAPSTRWRRVRPDKGGYGLTSMPYALWRDGSARDRREPAMIADGDYAIRCPARAFNAGETVSLFLT